MQYLLIAFSALTVSHTHTLTKIHPANQLEHARCCWWDGDLIQNSSLPPPRRLWFCCCLPVSNFVQKPPNGFAWNFQGRLAMGQCWQWANELMIKFWRRSGTRIWIGLQIVTLVRRGLAELCSDPVLLVALLYFWATVSQLASCIKPLPCLSVLSVCDFDVLWPNGWMDLDETWHWGRPRPRLHNGWVD